MLNSGRQEAEEGYSVRQHVFQAVREYGRQSEIPVYGLFIAPTINLNTAATFKNGEFHDIDDSYRLDIIPITIARFNYLFNSMFIKSSVDYSHFKILIERSLDKRDVVKSPQKWSESIEELVGELVESF